MSTSATLAHVSDAADDEPLTPRKLAGKFALQEIARLPGPNKRKAITELAGVSESTIANIRTGKESVKPEMFWQLAGALGLPTHFFEWIIACDTERIARAPGRDVDPIFGLREELRQEVLEGLEALAKLDAPLPRQRRKRG